MPFAPGSSADVVIIGGGPAGSAAARLLARWGHSVILLTRPQPASRLAESLPPSIKKLLRVIEVEERVERAEFYPTTGNTCWWTGSGPRVEYFDGGETGYQVERAKLDRLLLNEAESGGARIYRDARVTRVELGGNDGEASRGPRVRVTCAADGPRQLGGHLLLDCSGRSAVLARLGFCRRKSGVATVALVGVWSRPQWSGPDPSHTLVEAYEHGWAWSIPVSPQVRYTAAMIDPRLISLRERSAPAAYLAEMEATRAFRTLLAGAQLMGEAWACDATPHSVDRCVAPGVLLVGDAASFVDPLSSCGVKKALASAWLAAVTVNTILKRPEMESVSLDFYATREQAMYASCQRQAVEFFRQGAEDFTHPFWTGRSEPADDEAGADVLEKLGLTEVTVRAAFEQLKRTPSIRLRPTPALKLEPRPAVRDREIVLEQHVVARTPSSDEAGFRVWRGVDVPRLIELSAAHGQVPDLFEGYNAVCRPVSLPDFLAALSLLLASGLLQNTASQSAGSAGL